MFCSTAIFNKRSQILRLSSGARCPVPTTDSDRNNKSPISRLIWRPAPVPMVMMRAPQRVAFRALSIGCPQTRSSTTSIPSPPASLSASTSLSSPLRRTVSSAMPRSFRRSRDSSCRAAAMTFPAPRYFASCRAICPRVPVAPRIRTVSPGWMFASSSGIRAPVAAIPIVIAVRSSI